MKKVVKFGGSSLASAEQFEKVGKIIRADESRRYVGSVCTRENVFQRIQRLRIYFMPVMRQQTMRGNFKRF